MDRTGPGWTQPSSPSPFRVRPIRLGHHQCQHFGDLGVVQLPFVVSSLATEQSDNPDQRDSTEIIFFSTIDLTVGVDDFPLPTGGTYQLLATFTGAHTTPVTLWSGQVEVPITINPRQIPMLVSAGIAESAYQPSDNYSTTSVRQRSLWFEFDQPPQDPNDAYFVRVTNYGPDPLLMSNPVDITPTLDTPIALDPEQIRTITPDLVNDDAGLSAMTQVEPSVSSPVHFLVPLPDGISPAALDLFGFWSDELGVGHLLWSTAQGRFGRPFSVRGVQHPCRQLIAAVDRNIAIPSDGGAAQPCIVALADLAQTVLDGESLTSANAPQTQIWFLLYAELRRVDGQAYRNILLTKLVGRRPPQITPQDIPSSAGIAADSIHHCPGGVLGRRSRRHPHRPAPAPLTRLSACLQSSSSTSNRISFPTRSATEVPNRGRRPAKASDTRSSSGASAAVATLEAAPFAETDPLGSQLGSQRILRVSPLTPVSPVC